MRHLDGPRWGPKSGGRATCLVVLIHGLGANGHDLIDLGPAWGEALPDAAFAAPDAPEQNGIMPFGRQWFDVGDRTPARLAAGVAVAASDLLGFVDAELARLRLPLSEVALMGFSQGAMVALHAGLRRPVPPRAILAFSGSLLDAVPARDSPAPPVLLVHGERDEVVPAERSVLAERALRAASVPVESLFVPALGHGIDAAGLSAGALFLQRAFAATASEELSGSHGS
jgi:phospholipase/carboxylesterase